MTIASSRSFKLVFVRCFMPIVLVCFGTGILSSQTDPAVGGIQLFEEMEQEPAPKPDVTDRSSDSGMTDAFDLDGASTANAVDAVPAADGEPAVRPMMLDEIIPAETSRLPEDRKPVLVATRRSYQAIAARLGKGRWKIVNVVESGNDSRTDPPSQHAATVIPRALLVLVDGMEYSDTVGRLLESARPGRTQNVGISSIQRLERPGGELKLSDVAAGTDFEKAKKLSRLGLYPEPPGGRISEAIRVTWTIAKLMTNVDPDAGEIYFNRAWELSSELIELRSLASARFSEVRGVEFWVTDGYAMALALDVGLPVGGWIDRTLLTTPSGARMKELIDQADNNRRIIVLTTQPSVKFALDTPLPPISHVIRSKLALQEVILRSMESENGLAGCYKRVQAINYDRIYRAIQNKVKAPETKVTDAGTYRSNNLR